MPVYALPALIPLITAAQPAGDTTFAWVMIVLAVIGVALVWWLVIKRTVH